jgi:hypothetical protein
MKGLPSNEITLEWVGSEREPVVIVDGFVRDAAALRRKAAAADFDVVGDYYPGERAPAPECYLEAIAPLLREVLREFFDYRDGGEIIRSYFSIASTPGAKLTLAQRIPHTDAYDDHQIAILHYLADSDLGGTGFFRHLTTGFESVNASRKEPYHTALKQDFARHGEPAPAYIGECSPIFERIHLCEHRFNRALVYRGKLLHCAALDTVQSLPASMEEGRLTVATFVAPRGVSKTGELR